MEDKSVNDAIGIDRDENRKDKVPLRRSVRKTHGLPPIRYTQMMGYSRPAKATKQRSNSIAKCNAITSQVRIECRDKVPSDVDEARQSGVGENPNCGVPMPSNEECDIQSMHETENEILKDEIVALRLQLAHFNISMCDRKKDGSVNQRNVHEVARRSCIPVTSTPQEQSGVVRGAADEFSSAVDRPMCSQQRVIRADTNYMSALDLSKEDNIQQQQPRYSSAADILQKIKKLQYEYDRQHQYEKAHQQQVKVDVHHPQDWQSQLASPTVQQQQYEFDVHQPQQWQQQVFSSPSPIQQQRNSPIQFNKREKSPLLFNQQEERPYREQREQQWQEKCQQPEHLSPHRQQPNNQFQDINERYTMPSYLLQHPQRSQYSHQLPRQYSEQQPKHWQQHQPTYIQHQQPQYPQQLYETNNSHSGFQHFMTRQGAKDLPKFDGNPDEWLLFSTQYWRTTEMCKFSMDENLQRLQRCLHGPAREAVKALLVLPQNVNDVMQTLYERFGRDEYVIKSLIDKTRRIPAPREDQPQSFIEFSSVVNNMVVTLKNLGRPEYLMNPQLLEDIEAKLPPMLSMLWSNAIVGKQRYTIDDFNNWLHKQSQALSMRVLPKDAEKRKPAHKVYAAAEKVTLEPKPTSPCLCCKQQCLCLAKCEQFLKKSVDDRYQLAKKVFACFSCLNPGHAITQCRRNMRCDQCGARHNTLLHKPRSEATPKKASVDSSSHERELCATIPAAERRTLLKVIPVTLCFGDVELLTCALFDSGSTVTLLREDIARELGATGPVNPICIQWGDGSECHESNSQKIDMHVKGNYDGAKKHLLEGAKTVKRLPQISQHVNKSQLCDKWPYLQDIPFADIEKMQCGILIGEDNAFVMAPQRVVKHDSNSPIATKTPLGWVISGKVANHTTEMVSDTDFVYHACENSSCMDELHRLVKSSFVLDDFGVKTNMAKGHSREDERALVLMNETAVRMPEHRWEIGLLWRDKSVPLPESKKMAMMRLHCLERRLDGDAVLRKVYAEKINDYIVKGYFVRADDDYHNNQHKWFLPHFPVVNPNKPGKLRVVFDAAAKSHGRSLNDFLMTGPDLLKSLTGVLFRFRQHRVGFIGDIKEMYHRVGIRSVDQNSQLILWRGDDRQREPDVYKMTAMTFGASCSPSAAMYIKDKNAEEFADEYQDATKIIIHNHYVDDCLASADDERSAAKLIKDICYVHAQGGFEIRNWACSSNVVLKSIPEELRLTHPKQIARDEMERILGIWWDPAADIFTFRLKQQLVLVTDAIPTKRQVLKLLMTIYDPLGMLAHVLIRGKIIMQSVWKSGIGWDDELPSALGASWNDWLRDLPEINRVRVPRYYSSAFSSARNLELHIFCDASEQAYCAVAYFRIQCDENVEISFVVAKTRVAPLKTSTIPRLELQAALIGSRLASNIMAEHDIKPQRLFMWSDSRTVLAWVRAQDRRFRQYAAQRVGEILEHTNKNDWRWVPTHQNVADDATRITGRIDLESTGRWYSGPPFLKSDERDWPKETVADASDVDLEVIQTVCTTNLNTFVFEFERYSTILRLLRVIAWMMRFIDRLRAKTPELNDVLSSTELDRAEVICLRVVQRECFPAEVRLVSSGEPVEKSSSLFKLCPRFGLDGLLRVGGRLDLMDGDKGYAQPIILDGRHRFCELLLRRFHNKYDHQNDATVLNELRQKYWVIGGRRELKRLKQICAECRIRKACPEQQLMGQLPRVRLEYGVPPFTRTGVDYFGPIEVAVGRRREKRYGVLFTCMTCRAVHIDAAASLSTDSFLMAWRRFVARRGVPKEMLSDNGTNFRGADAELRRAVEEMDNNAVIAATANRGVTWSFIPPGSPHFGGCWERLVRSVKSSLSITLKNRRPPSDELLHTLLIEAENVVNSRPLTDLPVEHPGEDVITPNHLLIGRSSADAPIGLFNDSDLILRKQWRSAQRLADIFWATWVRAYLPKLTLRQKWHKLGRKLSVGDVVLIADANEPRNSWPKGVIERVYPGADGVVRVVDVRTASGTSKRPVHKICLLVMADSAANGSDLPRQSNTEREYVENNPATV